MIVEMDEIDIKDKLNNLRLVLKAKAKAKSKYGKGKRKQKVAVHTKTGKVVMATRTVGEGTPVIHGKATPQMLKQAQAKKDAINGVFAMTGKVDIKTIKNQLDMMKPELGITENDIKAHFKRHGEMYEASGRGNNKTWRIKPAYSSHIPVATDHTSPNVPIKGKKKVKEKPKKISTVHPDNYPDPATISGTLYPPNTTDDSDFIDFIDSHPDNKDENKDFHPGIKDPKWARKAEFVRILQGIIYPKSGFGHGTDWEKEKKKPDVSNLTMEQVESALRLANMTTRNTINRTAYYHFGGVANGKNLSKKREEVPITLRDIKSIYEPCLNFDYEKSLKLWKDNARDQKKGRETRKPKKSDYEEESDGLLVLGEYEESENPKPIKGKPAPSKPVKVKKVKKDGSQVSGRGTRKPVDPLRDHAMNRPMMDNFFKEKEAKINQHQDTKGWTDALEAFEKQGKSIPRSQFHALKNKFGVKDHKMHAPEWVHDKKSDSYVHKPQRDTMPKPKTAGKKKKDILNSPLVDKFW